MPDTTRQPSRTDDRPGWLARLWGYMLRHRRDLLIAFVAAVLGSACQVVTPLVARQIVDGVIVDKTSPLLPWLGLLVGLAIAAFFFAYLRRYRGGRVALHVQNDLRNDMHDHLQVMDQGNLSRMPTGQLVARANSDSTLVQVLLNFVPIMTGNVLMLVLSLVIMFVLSPLLALVSLAVIPALFAVSYRMRTRVFPATWDGQQREGDLAQIVDEDTNGVRVVKAFGQENRELERLTATASKLYGSQMRAVRIQSRYQPLLEAIPAIGQVGVLALGGWLAINGNISLGTFLAFSTYIAQLLAPARQLAGILTIGQQARAGIERIFQLLDLKPAISDAADARVLGSGGVAAGVAAGVAGADAADARPLVPVGGAAAAEVSGAIDFDDVTFAYDDGPPVLDGFALHIRPGERVALVGASGSGKSTVTDLIPRFADPSAGSVRIDGQDLREVTLASLRGAIGMVFEESFLFSESVRFNLSYGRPDADDEQIFAAARAAQADEFIRALPRGYDTVVGERGLSLSGGQRQRIALARAILADPRILVLDDATSAVDSRTEERIHDALRELLPGRTVVLVAHRFSTLHLADRVVLVHNGRVADDGTHEQLFARNADYRALLAGDEDDPITRAEERGLVDALAASVEAVSHGVDADAWQGSRGAVGGAAGAGAGAAGARGGARSVGAPSIGPGLGGGGGGWRMNLAPTPELLARVAALPPIRDEAQIDLPRESRRERSFSLRHVLREFRRPLSLGLVLVIIDALAGLVGPAIVKSGVDNGIVTKSAAALFIASALFLVVVLADLANEVGETFIMGRLAQRIMLSLRIRIFAQLQRLSLDYYEREMSGRIMTRMTTDVDQFESLIENGLLSALVAFVTFVGVGVALVIVDLPLGFATLTVVIPLAIATVFFRRRAAVLYDQSRERIAVVNADFQESLSGVRESQAFVHEARTMARFHGFGARYLESRVGAQRLVATYFPFVQFLSGVADAIVLGLGAVLIVQGNLTAGALIAFLLYIDMFFSPIQQLSQVFDAWQQTRVSVSRITELMALDTLTPDRVDARPAPRLEGEMAIEGVHFAYPVAPARPGVGEERRGPSDVRDLTTADAQLVMPTEALSNILLDIEAGQRIALVGETGAGKSTVMKLIARFYDPDQGRVTADGLDLRALRLGDYRQHLGYVPQEAFLFTGTVRDNIAYGRPSASDAEVEAAARAVGAHDFVAELPGGYLTEVAERGRSLSAGQRQLLALARAQLVDPAILLLDEATSNLDLATESRVQAAMDRVSHGRTTVLIAHRLQTARSADRIVVLDRGRIAEAGSHDELLAAGGRYAAMWRAFETVGAGAGAGE